MGDAYRCYAILEIPRRGRRIPDNDARGVGALRQREAVRYPGQVVCQIVYDTSSRWAHRNLRHGLRQQCL